MLSNKKKFLLLLGLLTLLAAGCAKIQLQQTALTSPSASYNELPK